MWAPHVGFKSKVTIYRYRNQIYHNIIAGVPSPILILFIISWQLDKLTLHTIDRENPEKLPESYNDEELNAGSTDDVQYEITVQEEQLAKMNPNLAAIQQYKKKASYNNQILHDNLSIIIIWPFI